MTARAARESDAVDLAVLTGRSVAVHVAEWNAGRGLASDEVVRGVIASKTT